MNMPENKRVKRKRRKTNNTVALTCSLCRGRTSEPPTENFRKAMATLGVDLSPDEGSVCLRCRKEYSDDECDGVYRFANGNEYNCEWIDDKEKENGKSTHENGRVKRKRRKTNNTVALICSLCGGRTSEPPTENFCKAMATLGVDLSPDEGSVCLDCRKEYSDDECDAANSNNVSKKP